MSELKKVSILVAIGFFVITAVMLYVLNMGVSIRSGAVIRPSLLQADAHKLTTAMLARLAPEFERVDYILLGLPDQNVLPKDFLLALKADFERLFGKNLNVIEDNGQTDLSQHLRECLKPCLLTTDFRKSHGLSTTNQQVSIIDHLGQNHVRLTILPFTRDSEVPPGCDDLKEITFECLTPLSVREVKRRFRKPERYFFMRKYKLTDYFLFIEMAENSQTRSSQLSKAD